MGRMKRSARDPKPIHRLTSPARTLDERRLCEVRGGSSVIKPEQMAQITATDDWLAPV
jgi:hypothetical protein